MSRIDNHTTTASLNIYNSRNLMSRIDFEYNHVPFSKSTIVEI